MCFGALCRLSWRHLELLESSCSQSLWLWVFCAGGVEKIDHTLKLRISLLAVLLRRGRKNAVFYKTALNLTISVLAVSPKRGWKKHMTTKNQINFTISVLAVSPKRGCKKHMTKTNLINFTISALAVSPNRGWKKTQNHKVEIAV